MLTHKIGMLWIGGSLSFLERLCVQSFLDAGHEVRLYSYDTIGNVPDGTIRADASRILAGPPFIRHARTNSLALHSDLFRFRLLARESDIIWADTDAYCVRPFQPQEGHYHAFQAPGSVNGGVLALPQDSETLLALNQLTETEYPIPDWFPPRQRKALQENPVHVSELPWGVWGPTAVNHYLHQTGEIRHSLPQEVLYPIGFAERGRMINPSGPRLENFGPETASIHFYGSRMRRMLTRRHNGIPPKGCLIDQLLIRHGIRVEDGPLPPESPAPETPASTPAKPKKVAVKKTKVLAITCMKDEGVFIPEWIAYHQSIGFDHFLIFTNDCSDGTDLMIKRLEELGIATHRDNTRGENQRASYQIRAFRRAMREPIYQTHDWAMILDVDEYLNIHAGDKTLSALLAAVPQADTISVTWRLFGNADVENFTPDFLTETFDRAAPLHCPRPAQAWGIKSLFRTNAFERLGTHRPLIPKDGNWDAVNWVNGSGQPMPERYRELTKGNWRSSPDCVGYDLAQLNHYALRSRQSFLLKSLKGTVHGGIDRNLDYWERMNRNEEQDLSIKQTLPSMRAHHQRLMADPELARLHKAACDWHRDRIVEALKIGPIKAMYDDLGKKGSAA